MVKLHRIFKRASLGALFYIEKTIELEVAKGVVIEVVKNAVASVE